MDTSFEMASEAQLNELADLCWWLTNEFGGDVTIEQVWEAVDNLLNKRSGY